MPRQHSITALLTHVLAAQISEVLLLFELLLSRYCSTCCSYSWQRECV